MIIGLSASINRALSGGTAPFNPISLSPTAWYDPSDLSTLWQDSARTTPVTTTGQPVGCVDDKSGNGNKVTQASSSLRAQYNTSGGLHWLSNDGVDDILSSTATNTIGATYTLAMLADAGSDASSSSIVIASASASSTVYLHMSRRGDINRANGASRNASSGLTTAVGAASTYPASTKKVMYLEVDANNLTLSDDVGVIVTQAIATPPWTGFSSAQFNLFGFAGFAALSAMEIYQFLAFNGTLTAPQKADLTAWLEVKGGL